MQTAFNELIDSFLLNKIGISSDFVSISLANDLKENLQYLFAQQVFKSAGTGNQIVLHDKTFRSDKIYWLEKSHQNESEKMFFTLMDEFVDLLNRTCYTGITDYEFHYTMYESGDFYKKHIDQFRSNESRKYSIILYLNENWKASDGGELCIHQDGIIQLISPESGKMVFFQSNEMEHEVLITNKKRMSITGWLKTG